MNKPREEKTELPEARAQTAMLLDFYSSLLGEKQRQIMMMYYYEDMSLSEISEELTITRQGIHSAIKKSKEIMIKTEERLGLLKRFGILADKLKKISADLAAKQSECGADLSEIIKEVEEITENI